MRTFFFTPNFSSLSLFFLVITNALSSRIRIQRLRIIDCLVYALCTQRYTDSSVSISLSCLREIFHALCASCAISLDYDCAGAERWRTTQLDFSPPPPFFFLFLVLLFYWPQLFYMSSNSKRPQFPAVPENLVVRVSNWKIPIWSSRIALRTAIDLSLPLSMQLYVEYTRPI